jgi:hypothetical protein
MKLVAARRKFPELVSSARNAGKSVAKPGARTWKSPTGVGTSRSRRGPKSTPLSSTAVESASKTWPPCPAAITRAARLSTVPK